MTVKLNGIDLSEFGIRVLRGNQAPVLPSTRDHTEEVDNRHGSYDYGADLSERVFELECFMKSDGLANLQKQLRRLAAFLVDHRGQPRSLELVYDIEQDKTYRVRYAGSLPIERLGRYGQFVLPLVAYDPFAYSKEYTITATVTDSPEIFEVTSEGTVQTPSVVLIRNIGTETINGFQIIRETEAE